MQVHSLESETTLFSFPDGGDRSLQTTGDWATSGPSVGIGSNTTLIPNGPLSTTTLFTDWTFSDNTDDYSSIKLRILVKMDNFDGVAQQIPTIENLNSVVYDFQSDGCEEDSAYVPCHSYNIIEQFSENDDKSYHIIQISTIDELNDLIHSNIRGTYLINSHGDNLPIHSDYFTGIRPIHKHKFLYDFETSNLGEISNHIYDRSGKNSDGRLVMLSRDLLKEIVTHHAPLQFVTRLF